MRTVVVFVVALTAAVVMAVTISRANTPACHSTQEDSEIYDCNFDGSTHEWTRK